MPQYLRLDDREQRNGQELGRKQVFLVTNGDVQYIEMRFSTKFRPLYDRTLRAFEMVPQNLIGNVLRADDHNLILQVEYLGQPVIVTSDNFPRILSVLEALYDVNPKEIKLTVPRYLTSLAETHPELNISTMVDRITVDQFFYPIGYGIDDPVFSNFTESGDGIRLVDLDHFRDDISLGYQIGFAAADLDTIGGLTLMASEDDIVSRIAKVSVRSESLHGLPLVAGYISRLGIDVINEKLGMDSYRAAESAEAIIRLSS